MSITATLPDESARNGHGEIQRLTGVVVLRESDYTALLAERDRLGEQVRELRAQYAALRDCWQSAQRTLLAQLPFEATDDDDPLPSIDELVRMPEAPAALGAVVTGAGR